MTTNVIDRTKLVVASDSRWSMRAGNYLFYVDDTGFDKIAQRFQGGMICAGDGALIDEWKNWFLAPRLEPAALPRVERIDNNGNACSISITLMDRAGQILFSNGWYLTLDEHALFTGSGAEYAYRCFSANRSAQQAVVSARVDEQTGGEVKFLELSTNRHNLSSPHMSLQHANDQLLVRGWAKDMNTKTVIPMSEYVANQNAAGGNVSAAQFDLSAPTGQPTRGWTKADKDRLKAAAELLASMEEPSSN